MSLWKLAAASLFAGVVLNAAVLTIVALAWFFTLPAAQSHEEAAERHWHYYQELNEVSE